MKDVEIIKARNVLSSRARTNLTKRLRVAAYCRVSTDSEDQLNSYKSQVQHYTDLIKSKSEWDLAGIYADATVIIGLKQNPTYGRRFSPIFLRKRAFCGAKRKMLL